MSDAGGAAPDAGSMPAEFCSGCPDDPLDPDDDSVHVHHLHLHATDVERSVNYYVQHFGAQPVRLNGRVDALWAAPMLLLFDEVKQAPDDTLDVGLEHFGQGRPDPVGWFETAAMEGVVADSRPGAFPQPVTLSPALPELEPFIDPEFVDEFSFVYLRGPGDERVEVFSDGSGEFLHVHFMTHDVDTTVAWYSALLDRPAEADSAVVGDVYSANAIWVGAVQLYFEGPPIELPDEFAPTDDRPLAHIAFSAANLGRMRTRADELGLEVVADTASQDAGFDSFFVRGPDHVLVEIVESSPVDAAQ